MEIFWFESTLKMTPSWNIVDRNETETPLHFIMNEVKVKR